MQYARQMNNSESLSQNQHFVKFDKYTKNNNPGSQVMHFDRPKRFISYTPDFK